MSYGRSDDECRQVKAALRYNKKKNLCDVTVPPQFLFFLFIIVILALFPPTHAR